MVRGAAGAEEGAQRGAGRAARGRARWKGRGARLPWRTAQAPGWRAAACRHPPRRPLLPPSPCQVHHAFGPTLVRAIFANWLVGVASEARPRAACSRLRGLLACPRLAAARFTGGLRTPLTVPPPPAITAAWQANAAQDVMGKAVAIWCARSVWVEGAAAPSAKPPTRVRALHSPTTTTTSSRHRAMPPFLL